MKTAIVARVSQDAKVNTLEGGKTVINFSVAVNEGYKNKQGEWVNKVQFVSCSYWKENSSIADYLKKGTSVHLEGSIEPRAYRDKKKKIVAYLQLNVKYIQLLGSKHAAPAPVTAGSETEDTPF